MPVHLGCTEPLFPPLLCPPPHTEGHQRADKDNTPHTAWLCATCGASHPLWGAPMGDVGPGRWEFPWERCLDTGNALWGSAPQRAHAHPTAHPTSCPTATGASRAPRAEHRPDARGGDLLLWGGAAAGGGGGSVVCFGVGVSSVEGTLFLPSRGKDIPIHCIPLPTAKPQTSAGDRGATPTRSSARPLAMGWRFLWVPTRAHPKRSPYPGAESWVPLCSGMEWFCRGIGVEGEQLSCAQPHPSPGERRAEGDALKIAGGIFDPEKRIPAGRERRGRER